MYVQYESANQSEARASASVVRLGLPNANGQVTDTPGYRTSRTLFFHAEPDMIAIVNRRLTTRQMIS